MLTSAPWAFQPPDYIGASRAGAGLGLQRAQLETGANEAADRLRLSYAQLASQNAQHAAGVQGQMAERAAALALRQAEDANMGLFRQGELADKARRTDLMESTAAARLKAGPAKKFFHVGNGLYAVSPDSTVDTLLKPPAGTDPYSKLRYADLLRQRNHFQTGLMSPAVDEKLKPALKTQLDEVEKQIKDFEKSQGGNAASSLDGSDFDSQLLDSIMNPDSGDSGDEGDQGSASDALQVPAVAAAPAGPKTLKVGKYTVTPLN